jgi:glycosyltransferase involved in cell wall biosynthesis
VDAIIVPTARKASAMEPAIMLAARLGCTLVALCSRWSVATEVVKIARPHKANVVVIDMERLPNGLLPRLAADDMLAGTRFHRSTDTSQKRNLGLLIARLCDWQRVVFLDDDIIIPNPEDLRTAAGLTEIYAGVGLSIDGNAPNSFPDNSVVCHAYREAGGDQGMFIGGGALAIGAQSINSFFPNIYNEDWFFLLGEDTLRPVTATGRVFQRPYDPFLGRRAQTEELGDCLAEGLFWLLDTGRSLKDADEQYWKESLHRRREFITEVVAMVNDLRGTEAKRLKMLASLRAARDRCERIRPELCTRYVALWRDDRDRWRQHVDVWESHRDKNVEKVLSALGLAGQARYLCS